MVLHRYSHGDANHRDNIASHRTKALLGTTLKQAPLLMTDEPVDIAGAAILLASSAGRFITGQTFIVDGGVTIGGKG
jgi:NAD(P)-dependent dehydrogenase (short-subunit alcohol dehydrogenase family)